MMDVRRPGSSDYWSVLPSLVSTAGSDLVSRLAARIALPLAGLGFGLMLVADAVHPLTLILLQIYLAF